MSWRVKVRNALRGIRQQWGSPTTKRTLWDTEYGSGRWDHCEHTPEAPVYFIVEKYCAGGSILDLGCGSGNTGNELDIHQYSSYTGVDISQVAIDKAAARSQRGGRERKNRFIQGDIMLYVPKEKYDVILLRESIYYIPRPQIKRVLDRYASYLTERGVFVVDVGGNSTKKAHAILEAIERNYTVRDKYSPAASREFVVVFN